MLKQITCFVLGILVALTVTEVGVRVLADTLDISPYMRYDEQLGWIAQPGVKKHQRNDNVGFDVIYELNGKGLRGPSYALEKPAGVFRIVVLGDSIGFGWGIAEGKQFSSLINEQLDNVEVINLSLSGYGTDQEYLRFVRDGAAYKPDLVVLQVTHNDFEEILHPFFNQKPKPQFLVGEDGNLQLRNVPVRPVGDKCQEFYGNSLPLPFKDWFGWNSYSYNFFNEKYYSLSRSAWGSHSSGRGSKNYLKESRGLFRAIVAQLKTELDRVGAKGVLVYASRDLNDPEQFTGVALPRVNLYQKFEEFSNAYSTDLFYKDGFHWNEKGNMVAAEELIRIIKNVQEGVSLQDSLLAAQADNDFLAEPVH